VRVLPRAFPSRGAGTAGVLRPELEMRVTSKGGPGRGSAGQRGFTLVELVIVVIVLGVLAAVVVPSFQGFVNRGRDRAFETDQRLLQAAVDAWRTDVANRAGNPWPTMGGVKGTPVDANADGDYLDGGDTNSFVKLSLLVTGGYIKGADALKSYAYAPLAIGNTGVPSTSLGSYLWYLDANGVVQALYWNDANGNGLVDGGETASGFQEGIYP